MSDPEARVVAVCRDNEHRFSKRPVDEIVLLAGLGVEGDAHRGETVQHRSRVARDPSQPNLRQVHLIQTELFAEVGDRGFDLAPGGLGENVTTRGIDLLGLPQGTLLLLGEEAVVEVTGLRNPCSQINTFQSGLMRELLPKGPSGDLLRRAGVMGVVVTGGVVRPGNPIVARLPALPHRALEPV